MENKLFINPKHVSLLDALGVPVSETRENALDKLWNMIDSGALSAEETMYTGEALLSNLSVGPGKEPSDSVFLRTYSALLIGVIVSRDQLLFEAGKKTFLDEPVFCRWLDASVSYYESETDLRGYIPGKGWAQAVSHGADLLRDLSFHRCSGRTEHLRLMDALLLQFAKFSHEPLNNNDDNRIARFLITVLLREEITPGDFENWLLKLETRMNGRYWLEVSESPEDSMVFFNIVTVLRAVYLSLEFGIKKLKSSPLYEKSPPNREELKRMLLSSLYRLDNGLNYAAT